MYRFNAYTDNICVYSELISRDKVIIFCPRTVEAACFYYEELIDNIREDICLGCNFDPRTWRNLLTKKCEYATYVRLLEYLHNEHSDFLKHMRVRYEPIKGLKVSAKAKGRLKRIPDHVFVKSGNQYIYQNDTFDEIDFDRNIKDILTEQVKIMQKNGGKLV